MPSSRGWTRRSRSHGRGRSDASPSSMFLTSVVGNETVPASLGHTDQEIRHVPNAFRIARHPSRTCWTRSASR
jgi:hypothetical protein